MSTAPESEWATRKQRIDSQLAACGSVVEALDPHNPAAAYTHHALTEFPTANGPADSTREMPSSTKGKPHRRMPRKNCKDYSAW
jgi:hypothetical protein